MCAGAFLFLGKLGSLGKPEQTGRRKDRGNCRLASASLSTEEASFRFFKIRHWLGVRSPRVIHLVTAPFWKVNNVFFFLRKKKEEKPTDNICIAVALCRKAIVTRANGSPALHNNEQFFGIPVSTLSKLGPLEQDVSGPSSRKSMNPETEMKEREHHLRDKRLPHALWLTFKKHNDGIACKASARALAPPSLIMLLLKIKYSMVPFAL